MRTVLAVALCMVFGACDYGLEGWENEPRDFRYGFYDLETEGPVVLWEGSDGSKFQIVGAELLCGRPNPLDYETIPASRPCWRRDDGEH